MWNMEITCKWGQICEWWRWVGLDEADGWPASPGWRWRLWRLVSTGDDDRAVSGRKLTDGRLLSLSANLLPPNQAKLSNILHWNWGNTAGDIMSTRRMSYPYCCDDKREAGGRQQKNAILDGCSTVDSKLDYDGIGWYSMVLHGIQWYFAIE